MRVQLSQRASVRVRMDFVKVYVLIEFSVVTLRSTDHVKLGPELVHHVVLSEDHLLGDLADAVGSVSNSVPADSRHTRAVGADGTRIRGIRARVTELGWQREVETCEGTRLAKQVRAGHDRQIVECADQRSVRCDRWAERSRATQRAVRSQSVLPFSERDRRREVDWHKHHRVLGQFSRSWQRRES
jgi:hypothetical protein